MGSSVKKEIPTYDRVFLDLEWHKGDVLQQFLFSWTDWSFDPVIPLFSFRPSRVYNYFSETSVSEPIILKKKKLKIQYKTKNVRFCFVLVLSFVTTDPDFLFGRSPSTHFPRRVVRPRDATLPSYTERSCNDSGGDRVVRLGTRVLRCGFDPRSEYIPFGSKIVHKDEI